MEPTDVLVLAGALLLYALVSARAERGVVSPPMAFAALGLAVGSAGLGLVELSIDGTFVHDLAEITLALTLFTDAARIDPTELDRRHAIPLRLLGVGLPLAMLAGTGAAWALFPALGVWGAATLGVILAPTDAALGQAVVSNDSVPQRIRQALNVESGLNDGLAFPALLIVASLAAGTHDRDAGGWFGPRGLASVIYLLLVLEEYEIEGADDVRLAALVTVALSIVLHGASAAPLARRYGRAVQSEGVGGVESERVPGFALKLGGARAEDDAREDDG